MKNRNGLLQILGYAVILSFSLPLAATPTDTPQKAPSASSQATADLLSAAKAGDARRAEEALARGADANAPGAGGMRPLHFAAFRGDAALATAILGHGARVDPRDDIGMTPLHAAAFEGKTEVARLLLKRGADPSIQDASGYTPLQYARANGKGDVERLLLDFARLVPNPAQAARVITDDDLNASRPSGGKGFTVGGVKGQPSADATMPGSTVGDVQFPSVDGISPCRQRIASLQEHRIRITSNKGNYDAVDHAMIREAIKDEETNYAPPEIDIISKNTYKHDKKLADLRELDKKNSVLSERAAAETRQLDAEIAELQAKCP